MSSTWLQVGQNVSNPVDQLSIPDNSHVLQAKSTAFTGNIIWQNNAAFNSANFADVPVGTVVITYLAANASINVKEDDGTWTSF
jgi:hypothetical protein